MAKRQSKTRDIIDGIVAPSQFINYDGSAHAETKLGKIFSKVAKPWHLYTLGIGACFAEANGLNLALMGVAVALPAPIILSMVGKNKNCIVDTTGASPPTRNADTLLTAQSELKMFTLPLFQLSTAGALLVAPAVMSDINKLPALAIFAGPFLMAFSEYWERRQIVDGNWTITDEPPPKQASIKDKVLDLIPAAKPVPEMG